MDQIISGIIKSTHPISVKETLLQRFGSAYLRTPCSLTLRIPDRTCYVIINYVRELTLTKIDPEIVKFSRTCFDCCHTPECLCAIAEHLINDSQIDLSIQFVQLLSDRLPIEIGRPFLERAFFERHELNNDALHLILLTITKNRQLTSGQRTLFYIKLVELVLFRLRTLDHSIEQVELFCKQLSSTIEELCYENNQKSIHLLNDIVNGVTSGLLTCLADSTATNEPSTALANIIDLLQECPSENLLDSFILVGRTNETCFRWIGWICVLDNWWWAIDFMSHTFSTSISLAMFDDQTVAVVGVDLEIITQTRTRNARGSISFNINYYWCKFLLDPISLFPSFSVYFS